MYRHVTHSSLAGVKFRIHSSIHRLAHNNLPQPLALTCAGTVAHTAKGTVSLPKFARTSVFDQGTVFKNDNSVEIYNSAEPVGDNN